VSLCVLDTDTISLYRLGHARVCLKVDAQSPTDLAVTVLSVEEQVSGWYRMLRQAKQPAQLARAYQGLADTVQFYGQLQILPFSVAAIACYDGLRSLKLNVRAMDLRIAAVTLEHGGILVTRNLRDFQRVPNLTVENWAV
jgi:tRNA(fMet)-specific endonuclease VapC